MKALAFMLLLLPIATQACLWVHGTTLDGERKRHGLNSATYLFRMAMEGTPEDKLAQLTRLSYQKRGDGLQQKEMEGVRYILKGNYDQGIAVLEEIEVEEPGRYSTATNLGTAFELKGDLPQALYWISEGIRRNPQSHYGTEWLHRRILEAKLALRENSEYLQEHHVVDIPDVMPRDYQFADGESSYDLDEIIEALEYQLQERMIFVKPPDPIVADLLYSYAIAVSNGYSVENGMEVLDLAEEYGFQNHYLVQQARERFERAIFWGEVNSIAKILLTLFLVILVLRYAYKRKWFFWSSRDYHRYLLEKSRIRQQR